MPYDWDGRNERLYDLSFIELFVAALGRLAFWR